MYSILFFVFILVGYVDNLLAGIKPKNVCTLYRKKKKTFFLFKKRDDLVAPGKRGGASSQNGRRVSSALHSFSSDVALFLPF